jgi:hypothetical protein
MSDFIKYLNTKVKITKSRLIIFLSSTAFCLSSFSFCHAESCQLNGKTVFVEQDGVTRIDFNVLPPDPSGKINGNASFPGHTGSFNGTLKGHTFDINVTWDSGDSGHYVWVVNNIHTIQGTTGPSDGGGRANLAGQADYCD